jgi:Tfp pilus assembly protein PilN
MIKVNLLGTGRKKAPRRAMTFSLPTNVTPVVLLLIVLGFAGGGYWWYSNLAGQSEELDRQKALAEKEKARLDAVIKADQVFESRKKALENRVKVIENLQKNQASPVQALDQLAEAVERTQFVWLSTLDQKEAILNMSGTGTSLNAIADFYTNLNATGYFRNVDQGAAAQDAAGNWTFSLKCEFSPPRAPAPTVQPNPTGGN